MERARECWRDGGGRRDGGGGGDGKKGQGREDFDLGGTGDGARDARQLAHVAGP